MAVESPPVVEQGSTYTAEQLRHAFGTLLQRGSSIGSVVGGLVGSGDMSVTAGSGMQVLVAPGEAWITGSSVATQGGYYARVTSSTALAISASNASNPRIETIIAQVKDKAYAGTEETFTVSVVVGTAEAGATLANKKGAGAVPASSLVLAYVLVPAKAASIEAADIENVAPITNRSLALIPAHTGAITLVSGQAVEMATAGAIATLPAQVLNAECEVWCTASSCKVRASVGLITGDYVGFVNEVTLTQGQHLLVRSDSSNWLIIAGEPKQESSYTGKTFTKAEMEAGVEFSASRPAVVLCSAEPTALTISGASLWSSKTLWVPAGQKMKATNELSLDWLLR